MVIPPRNASHGPPRRRPWTWGVFAAGVPLNFGVCLPFVVDPFGWLHAGPTLAAAAGQTELVVLLAHEHDAQERARFFAAHRGLRILHEGTRLGTLLVQAAGPSDESLRLLRGQPFVAWVSRGTAALCR